MKKIIIPALCLAFFAACQQSTPKTAEQTADAVSTATDASVATFDTMPVAARLTAQNKNFVFTAGESFDRCDAVTIKRRDGKPMKISKEFKAYMECIHYTAQIADDRYMVFFDKQNVSLYDLESGTSQVLFVAQSFDESNLACLGWSPDKTRVAFVSTAYTPEAQQKLKYATCTRVIVLLMNADKTAVATKTKYDVPIQYFASEGDYVSKSDCFWADNNTLRYRNFVSDDYETVEKTPKKFVNLDITK